MGVAWIAAAVLVGCVLVLALSRQKETVERGSADSSCSLAVSHVKAAPRRWQAWSAIALYVAMSVSLDFPVVLGLVTRASEHSLLSFLLLRQVALASVILLLVLYLSLREELLDVRQVSATTTTPDEQLSAA